MHNSLWVGGSIGRRGFPMLGTGKRGLSTYIKDIFSKGEQGFAYDPNDLSTMFQDAAGTIPVTAAGQPVGLMLDKSKGLKLESNLVLGDGKHEGTELHISKSDGNGSVSELNLNTVNPISGSKDVRFKLTTVSSVGGLRPLLSVRVSANPVVGNFYHFSFKYKVLSGEAKIIAYHTGLGVAFVNYTLTGEGTFKMVMPYLGTQVTMPTLYFGESLFDMQMDDFEYRRIQGNHAYQTVSASRPVLQQTPILGNESALPNLNSIVVAANNGAQAIVGTGFAQIGKSYLISIPSGLKISLPSGWGSASTGNPFTVTANATGTFTVLNPTASPITLSNVSVKEITGYRTDQNYLAFDGVDDSLQTANIDFTATDKVSLFAGVRKLSDVRAGMVCELGLNVSTVAGTFFIVAPPSASAQISVASTGTVARFADATNLPAPISIVASASSDITANTLIIRVNGTQRMKNTASQGGGNYGNHQLFIGRRAEASLPFNGHLYSLIGIGRLTSDSETIALEKSIAKNTGVTLNV